MFLPLHIPNDLIENTESLFYTLGIKLMNEIKGEKIKMTYLLENTVSLFFTLGIKLMNEIKEKK